MKKRASLLIISVSATVAVFASALVVYAVGLNPQVSAPNEDASTKQAVAATDVKPSLPTADDLLKLVNEERAKAGVPSLQIDSRLNTSAQRKADDEAKYNYFGHVSPNDNKHGYEYISETDIACKTDSENLHDGTGDYSTAIGTVNGWMGSPAHKAAMLSANYSLTGFGVALMADGKTVTVVEHFCQT